MKISEKIPRRERRGIQKLKHSANYKWILGIFILLFSPAKKFVTLPFSAARKVFWVISLSIYKFLGYKIAYIDDFIIDKKLRGKWYAKKLFEATEMEAQKEGCDYMLLFSRKERKASHLFYKKAGLTIIGLWIGILAIKKFTRKK